MTERRRGERGSDCMNPSELFGQEVLEATWVCLRRHTFIKSSRADPVPAFSSLLASRHLPEESRPPPLHMLFVVVFPPAENSIRVVLLFPVYVHPNAGDIFQPFDQTLYFHITPMHVAPVL